MRITVLGGAGKMGCIATQFLAHDARVDEVILADYNLDAAKTVADYIKSSKIKIVKADVNDGENLRKVLDGSQSCVNATVYYTNLAVMQACLDTGTGYTDMGGLFHLTRKQLELDGDFKKAGVSAVLGMGSAPGVPNIQARYAAERLDTIEYIRIYDGIKPPAAGDVTFTYAVPTIIEELTVEPMVFENGEFKAKQPLTGFEDYWFAQPLGLLPMHYSLHSEVATLPISYKHKGVKECFFKINYWGMAKETVEKVRVLTDFGFDSKDEIEVKGKKIVPHDLLLAVLSGYVPPITDFLAPAKTKPPDWVKEIVTEVKGAKDGKEVIYRLGSLTCKGALPTGTAPAIASIWLAEGRIEPGVRPPELSIEPEPFFKELESQDIITRVTITQAV
jgi:saccharopine dehydrogenase-like NADP-dependent oxidoreductase